ncbi:MAG: glycosyltransferase [Lachnospiraceae bacterium]|nr:glycosyltransferase [Lachnospiraceae bacterium]
MTEKIEYSVVIRTIGKAGEKYRRLLDSVKALDPQPEEVIVVLPEGYDPPAEQLGTETFYFSPKGMVHQRQKGFEMCRSPYMLVCDDDVCFGPDFVKKLYTPIRDGLGKISAAPLYSFLPQKGIRAVIDCLSGAAAPTLFHRNRYVSVLNTSGYSYNRHLAKIRKYYMSQSLPGTCFFCETKAILEAGLEEEFWVDAQRYSSMEDQVLFYKAWLRGKKAVVVSDAVYEHLDAKTSTQGNRAPVLYAHRYNRTVFWKRFLYDRKKTAAGKAWCAAAYRYRLLCGAVLDRLAVLRGKYSKEDLEAIRQGLRDGKAFVRSAEYAALPKV